VFKKITNNVLMLLYGFYSVTCAALFFAWGDAKENESQLTILSLVSIVFVVGGFTLLTVTRRRLHKKENAQNVVNALSLKDL
jgi:hypothetical protein